MARFLEVASEGLKEGKDVSDVKMNDDVFLSSWSPRRLILVTVTIAGVIAAFYLAYLCIDLLLLLLMAILLATVLENPVEWLMRLSISKTLAVLAVHGVLVLILVAFALTMFPLIALQMDNLFAGAQEKYVAVRSEMEQSEAAFLRHFAENLPKEPQSLLRQKSELPATENLANAWLLFQGLFFQLFSVFAVFMLSIYWSLEGDRHIRSGILLLPTERRIMASEFIEQIQDRLGAFVRGQALLCLAIGIMSFAVYGLIGLPYVLLLAFITGILEVIPFLGTTLGAIPPVLLALTLGPWHTTFTIIGWLLIVTIEAYILAPRIMERSVGVHPVVTLLAISALFTLWGPLGGVLAIPLAAIVQLAFDRFVFPQGPVEETAATNRRDEQGIFLLRSKELLADVQSLIAQQKCPKAETELLETLEKELETVVAGMASANGRRPNEKAAV